MLHSPYGIRIHLCIKGNVKKRFEISNYELKRPLLIEKKKTKK